MERKGPSTLPCSVVKRPILNPLETSYTHTRGITYPRKTSGMKLVFTVTTSALLVTVPVIASPITPNTAAGEKDTVIVSATTISNIMHPTTTTISLRPEVSETAEKFDKNVNESDKSDESDYTTSDSEHAISGKDASSSSESHLNFLTRRNGLPKGLHCAHHGALWFAGCKNKDPNDCWCNYVKAWSVTWHRERPVRDSDGQPYIKRGLNRTVCNGTERGAGRMEMKQVDKLKARDGPNVV
ncbi:hypothetical protein GE21DRAFT_5349 [Neurospora crassa]|uniref:Uncharacterized protein n=1 Tax=Neurospora crassa (strain ATCC 24698 / 74-OR23-1A / CBS 708.71 / DSM 1257 / FGSC 987) TaxID=367110 RepID=Q7S1D4_NEUCR|nr:hypothetical protein NCU04901 [Neurospora crassa OR74A]EAA29174.1 hypothetical protein NCU04901 [Neurospora crassa OR74A]KHE78840.1 hypothetical protein GE21DRAFT_5349 [Neurospora crassa]|eukprot:XP_958410.1 hypothetical protein NCU04901 [Neurospora crassa OR74A]